MSLTGTLDPEGGARVLEVLNALNGRRPPVDGVPDLRSPARRNADALIEAMSGLLDEGGLPSRGGQRPHLVLTMKLSDLIDGFGTATLDTGGDLTAAEARRLACDSALIPMVLGSDSMPLDVGRQATRNSTKPESPRQSRAQPAVGRVQGSQSQGAHGDDVPVSSPPALDFSIVNGRAILRVE